MKKRLLSFILAMTMLLSIQVVAGASGTWYSIPSRDAVTYSYSVTNTTGSYLIGANTIYKYNWGPGGNFISIPYNTNFSGTKVFGGDDNYFYYIKNYSIYKAQYTTTTGWTDTCLATFTGPNASDITGSNVVAQYTTSLGLVITNGIRALKLSGTNLVPLAWIPTSNTNCKIMSITSGPSNKQGVYLRNDNGLYFYTNNTWTYVASINYTPATYDATVNSTCCDGTYIYFVGGADVVPATAWLYQRSIYKYNPSTGTTTACTDRLPVDEGRYDATCFFDGSSRLVVVGGDTLSTNFANVFSGTLS